MKTSSPLFPARTRLRVGVGAALVLLGGLSVGVRAAEYFKRDRAAKDFAIDYSSARALLHGRDPFQPIRAMVSRELKPPPDVLETRVTPGRNWHPPLKMLLTVPFALLPFPVAGLLWLVLSIASFLLAVRLFGSSRGWSRGTSLVVGIGSLALPIVQKDLSLGQVNCVLLLLLVVAWRALSEERDGMAGLALGGAIALKAFPVLLLLPLAGGRRWRAVFLALGSAALTSVASMAVIGFRHVPDLIEAGAGSYGLSHWESSPHNVSWWGPVTRWLTTNPWVAHLSLDTLGRALAITGSLVLVGWAVRPRASLSKDSLYAAVPIMLLAWPITWDHYAVLGLPWVVLTGREVMRRGGITLTLMFAVAALGLATGLPPKIFGGQIDSVKVALLYQLPKIGLVFAVAIDRSGRREEYRPTFEPIASPGR